MVRKTLTELAEEASLSADKRLMVDGMEVGVIYMRWVTDILSRCHETSSLLGAVTILTSTPVRGSGGPG